MTILSAPTTTLPMISVELLDPDPRAQARAERVAYDVVARVDRATGCGRPDGEVREVAAAAGSPVVVSPVLADLVAVALMEARRTGAVPVVRDPAVTGRGARRRTPHWRRVRLEGCALTVPAGLVLDLADVAWARAADLAAARVSRELGTGALVTIDDHTATAGAAPAGGWRVLVGGGGDPLQQVTLEAGGALSSLWTASGEGRWSSVTVLAPSAVRAAATAAGVVEREGGGLTWLRDQDLTARLVDRSRRVHRVAGRAPGLHAEGWTNGSYARVG